MKKVKFFKGLASAMTLCTGMGVGAIFAYGVFFETILCVALGIINTALAYAIARHYEKE